jgi:NAD(P)-dependent dehydrogenase (short-subunit alcohol dehydrogenase family)
MSGVAIVTGGADGPASAIAVRLAELGADLALLVPSDAPYAHTARRVAALDRRCLVLVVDPADSAAVGRAVDRVTTGLGDPEVLVNTVTDTDRFDATADALRSAFVTSRAVLDPMVMTGGGRIVHVVAQPGTPPYSTLRDGLEGFTRSVSRELRPFGITANMVVPAGPEEGIVPEQAEEDGPDRYPEQAAGTVGFLVGADASALTGQVIHAG